MLEISLCMIVKNEEAILTRCLDSVKEIVDEIIIVDTGSTDNTKEIAMQFTDYVFDFEWCDDFAAARNYSFSKASKPYLMWLDADDIITEKDCEGFLKLKNSADPSTDTFMLPYHNGFDQHGNITISYFRERIVKKPSHPPWQGVVHEVITPFGNIVYGECGVTHKRPHTDQPYSSRNLDIYRTQLQKGKTLLPREQFYYGRELYSHQYFYEAIHILETFLDQQLGWVENNIEACRGLSFCYSRTNNKEKSLSALFKSFQYDTPRAEVCCDIGNHFMEQKQYQTAIYWYQQALSIPRNDTTGAFVDTDSYGFLPNIQLCLCYNHLGDLHKANEYNKRAGLLKPSHPAYLNNKTYFEGLLSQND